MVRLVVLVNTLIMISSYSLEAHDITCTNTEAVIAREAIKQDFPPKIAIAIARVESGLNPRAKGKAGEIGLFQIMPYNAPRLALYDPKVNAHVGILLLKKYRAECSDMGPYYVICFNQGAQRRPKHPNLHPYYKRFIAEYKLSGVLK